MDDVVVAWDSEDDPEGNVAHIAEHDLTTEEVEDVLLNPKNSVVLSRSSGHPMTMGWTETGRFIHVIWETVNDDPEVIRVRTAFEPDPE